MAEEIVADEQENQVEPAVMTDEELDAAIKENQELENMPDEELEKKLLEPETPPEKKEEVKTEEQGKEQKEETKEEEKKGEEKKPEGEQKTAETPQKEEVPEKKEEVTLSKDELEKLRKQIADKEAFIGRQSNEIGNLRQQLMAAIKKQQEDVNENYLTATPTETFRKMEEIREAEHHVQMLDQAQRTLENKRVIDTALPDLPERMNDIVALLQADGMPVPVIQNFVQNPYTESLGVIFNLAKRAEAFRKVREYETRLQQMQAEMENLKKKPGEVLKKIEASGKNRPMTAAAAGSTQTGKATGSLDTTNLGHLTDKEIELMLQERIKEEK